MGRILKEAHELLLEYIGDGYEIRVKGDAIAKEKEDPLLMFPIL